MDSLDSESESEASLDSEKSYAPIFTKRDVYEFVTYLSFNIYWLFLSAIATSILFSLFTYQLVFEGSFQNTGANFFFYVVCTTIFVVDVVASILPRVFKRYAAIRDLPPRGIVLVTVDLLSIVWMFVEMIYSLKRLPVTFLMTFIGFMFLVFRLYRVVLYFVAVSKIPGSSSLWGLYRKYGLIFLLMVHMFSCILKYLSCYKCTNILSWTTTIDERIFGSDEISSVEWYVMSFFVVVGGLTTYGSGDVHAETNLEILIYCFIMLLGFILLEGAFVGAWSSALMESYRRQAVFAQRLRLIGGSLNHPSIPDYLKIKVRKFYHNFWREMHAVTDSTLFKMLPSTFREQTYLDMYWNAIKQTYLLKDLHPAFQRALATVMTTEIYETGELLYERGKLKQKMFYILKGNVQLMSVHDDESSVLTLGIGTCLGEMNLIYSVLSSINVRASSYCIAQCLKKEDFWRVNFSYRHLHQTRLLREKIEKKMHFARCSIAEMSDVQKRTHREQYYNISLNRVKNNLKSEENKAGVNNLARKPRLEQPTEQLSQYADLYILSLKQTVLKHSDEVFLHTTCPLILQPDSVFLQVWECLLCGVVLIVCFIYPFQITFIRRVKSTVMVFDFIVRMFFMLDTGMQLFTAIERDRRLVTNFMDLVAIRFQNPSFILDLIAGLPLVNMAVVFNVIQKKSRAAALINALRMLKIHRVFKLFNRLSNSNYVNTSLVRCIKYLVYFLLIAYFMSCTIYMLACFNPVCVKNSWFDQVVQEDIVSKGTRYKHQISLSMFYGSLIVSMVGYGNVTPLNMVEISANIIFALIGKVTFCYLVADYSATLMLSDRPRLSFVETVHLMKRYFISNGMLQSDQIRIDHYLELQWKFNSGYYFHKEHLLYDIPHNINKEIKAAKNLVPLMSIPLFQGLEKEIVELIATECKQIMLPPNEVVVYAGDLIQCLYILDKGHCEVISASTGKTEHILGPGSHFGDFDMLLEQPGIYNILTLTHTQITVLNHSHIKKIFSMHNLNDQLRRCIDEIKESFALQRLRSTRGEVAYNFAREEQNASWFTYPRRKLHPLNIEYEQGFDYSSLFKMLKFFFMRRTILPEGKFIKIWEVFQAVRIFFMGFYYLLCPVINAYYHQIYFLWATHTILVLVDMYVRMHVCYYNDSGILVSHPRYTACRYLTTSFITDFLGFLPIAQILEILFDMEHLRLNFIRIIEHVMILNILLPVYRIYGLFAYFEGDILKQRGPTLVIVKSLTASVLIFNAFATFLIAISCETSYDSRGYTVLTPRPDSWISYTQQKVHFNVSEPINMYVASLFWVSTTVFAMGSSDYKALRVSEMIFIMVAILIGYFMFTYILTVIVSYIAGIDINLTVYRERMNHLMAYMTQEEIHRSVQKKVIEYYEYIWERTHGMNSKEIVEKCHPALHQDCVLFMYEDTLKSVPVFKVMNTAFYRLISLQMRELYFLKGSHIIKLNDIVSEMYIIHRGEVQVFGPDGSLFATLGRGCMFGNIDRTAHSRSTTTVMTTSRVDILCLKTAAFYKSISNYPEVTNRLKFTILAENVPYIDMQHKNTKNQYDQGETTGLNLELEESKNLKILSTMDSIITIPLMLCSVLLCWLTIFHLASQRSAIIYFVVVYSLDVIHLVKIFNDFRMPYYDKIGVLITDRDLIKKRYMSLTRFYKDLVAILPLEIFAFFAPRGFILYALTWLRINRMLTMVNVFQFFDFQYKQRNTYMLTLKICSLLINFASFLHILVCLLYIFTCPKATCPPDSWLTLKHNVNKSRYLLNTYLLLSMLCLNGFSFMQPKAVMEFLICIFTMLIGKFAMALLVGNISALVQYHSYSLDKYNYQLLTLKNYLENNYVDKPLIYRLMSYVENMWRTGQGKQYPKLLCDAPSYLMEEVKRAAYGKHLLENYVFASCHVDFLRLLIAKLKVENFFEDDIICQQGDINDKMYFIHSGVVNVYFVSDVEQLANKLEVMDCFGLVQGLFGYTPHNYTYKAATKVIVVTLNLRKWAYLLRYYRASRLDIYTKLKKLVEAKENLNDLRLNSLRDL